MEKWIFFVLFFSFLFLLRVLLVVKRTSFAKNETENLIIEKFRKRKIQQLFLIIPIGPLIFLTQWVKYHPNSALACHGILLIFIVSPIILGCLLFSYFNWRCPACNKFAGFARPYPTMCPNCRVRLG